MRKKLLQNLIRMKLPALWLVFFESGPFFGCYATVTQRHHQQQQQHSGLQQIGLCKKVFLLNSVQTDSLKFSLRVD